MNPDDPRHGRRAGYIAGCRSECCSEPHRRYQKRSTLRRQREGSQIISAHRVLARTMWWNARGVSLAAICAAAGSGEGTLSEIINGRDTCLKMTERRVLAFGWPDLPDETLIYADMTRLRIYSLMAAGHPLKWITAQVGPGLPISGRWRTQERIALGAARRVMAIYEAAPLSGPSKQTLTAARNRGHRHPLAWDDPGEPGMPRGWNPWAEVAA